MTPGANCNICGRWRPARKLERLVERVPGSGWVTGIWRGEYVCVDNDRCVERWSWWDRLGGTRLGDAVRFRFANDPRDAS